MSDFTFTWFYDTIYRQIGGVLFKAFVLCSFVFATVMTVQAGYDALLQAMDTYVLNSYGRLSETDNVELQQAGQEITQNYTLHRQSH